MIHGLLRLALLSALGSAALASGPGFAHPLFEYNWPSQTEWPQTAAGEWQLLPAQAELSLRFAIHRQLIGHPETAPMLPIPAEDPAIKRWLTLRERLGASGPARLGSIEASAAKADLLWQVDWNRYRCSNHAFRLASETLEARAASHPEQRWLLEWIRGQDTVFASCERERQTFPALPKDAPDWLRDDRAYQEAAASFYSQPDEATIAAFTAIAADRDSPWRDWADFLIARTLARQIGLPRDLRATVEPAEDAEHEAAIRQKLEAHLTRLLADPARKSVHGAADELLGNLRGRADPLARAEAFAAWADQADLGPNRRQWLIDLQILASQVDRPQSQMPWWLGGLQSGRRDPQHPGWLLRDLNDAVYGFELRDRVAEIKRLMNEAESSPPSYDPSAKDYSELLQRASNVAADHPLAPAITFQRAQLLRFLDDRKGAWDESEQLLKRQGTRPWFIASRNLLARLRSASSPDLVSALPEMTRQAVGVRYEDDSDRLFWHRPEDRPAEYAQQRLLPRDTVQLFNFYLPLDQWLMALEKGRWDELARRELTGVLWLRAWLLGREDLAGKLAPAVRAVYPEAEAQWKRAEAASEPAERRLAEAVAILRLPALSPVLHGGFFRDSQAADEIGSMSRWRWWWANEPGGWRPDLAPTGELPCPSEPPGGLPIWVDSSLRASACGEQRKLTALGNGTEVLGRIVIDWVQAHPDDPEAPQMLHLVVRATRYGPSAPKESQRAFRLLHKRYPQSEWAKKTPHHY
ncbi:hypothetical protein [Chitinimonas lacunae]|uniref:Lytic transglycosylase domain-containing protein n=1 Tax=Chitinimonas lacunae TaxID=1963018 RepID=A0ABV8MWB7_9NEIS